ncbi:putative lipid II flippase FtsW [Ferroacidibacillus organovorans]
MFNFFFITLCLVAFGLVMVYSSSMVYALQVVGSSSSYFFRHQLLSAGIGFAGMFILMNVPPDFFNRHARKITLVILLCLILVLIPHIGHQSQNVRRWLGPPSLLFQPSEFSLLTILIYAAYIFAKRHDQIHSFKKGVIPPFLMIGLQTFLILKEPDMGTSMLLLLSGLAVMFAAGIRYRHMAILAGFLAPVLLLFIYMQRYRAQRLLVFLHPFSPKYANQGGYQLIQSFIAIYHGGWFGKGLGRGIQPFGYLPVPHADFIFAVIVEELGLVGAFGVLLAFSYFIWRGMKIAISLEDRFSSLLAIGIVSMITWGVIINVGAVSGLLPVTGIPLPFISYGGTALIVKLWSVGILLSLSRYTRPVSLHGSLRDPSPIDFESMKMKKKRNRTRKQNYQQSAKRS